MTTFVLMNARVVYVGILFVIMFLVPLFVRASTQSRSRRVRGIDWSYGSEDAQPKDLTVNSKSNDSPDARS